MKIKFIFLTLLLAIGGAVSSAQTLYKLGFCEGKVATESGLRVEGAADIEAAIYLSPSDMERFSGDSFAGVNAGIATKLNVRAITVWVRSELDGENLAEATIDIHASQKPRDGWNSIKFDSAVNIETGQGYYVGYTVSQTKTASIISLVEGYHAGAAWIKTDNTWSERDDLGILSIEALITGDNMPKSDLALLGASLSDSYYVTEAPITLSYELRNNGIEPVYSYVLTVRAEDTDMEVRRTIYNTINYGVTRSYLESLTLPGLEAGQAYNFTVTVDSPNGETDETPEDNSVTIDEIPVISKVFPRTVLLEKFTSERCTNCPAADETIHDMIESFSEDERARFAMVCHHSGYKYDDFTLECDKEYEWFYNNNGAIYAPAFMLDRLPETGSSVKTPVFENLPVNAFAYKVTQEQNRPALYSITMTGMHNVGERTVELQISGEEMLPVFDDPRITVYLVEDNVLASKDGMGQGGSGGRIFYHNHLERAYNATWGVPAEWDGASYTYTCKLEYPEGCKTEDMQVVAFISNFDSTDPVNCEVGNTTWLPLSSLGTVGVAMTTEEANSRIDIYDLSGRNVGNDPQRLTPGIYILTRNNNGNIATEKIIVR